MDTELFNACFNDDTEMSSSLVWTSALGEKIPFSEIGHQHLSNILWFSQVFHNIDRYNSKIMFLLGLELHKRFNGEKLEWRPLPLSWEVPELFRLGLINIFGDIIGNKNCNLFAGKKIGTITHIKEYETSKST
jgi:hypothetical protein